MSISDIKKNRIVKQCHICGDYLDRFVDNYCQIIDPTVEAKTVWVHRRCLFLDNERKDGIRTDKPNKKAEAILRFKTLDFYRKLTDEQQRKEAERKEQLSKNRRIRVVKNFQEQN